MDCDESGFFLGMCLDVLTEESLSNKICKSEFSNKLARYLCIAFLEYAKSISLITEKVQG